MKGRPIHGSVFCKQIGLNWTNVARYYHRMSLCFRPVNETSLAKPLKGDVCRSQRLMLDNGLIRGSAGGFHLLPLAMRSLEKIIGIIDRVLGQHGCQKIQMPALTAAGLWESTGRLQDCGTEILLLKDRHDKSYLLSPTHEEAVCDLIRSNSWSHKHLPLRVYQITSKFRDEMRPRHGLLRAREFVMKDLYTFDVDQESAMKTYEEINHGYQKIFDDIGIQVEKVRGDSGVMGGNVSHEYHIASDVGEDQIGICGTCKFSFNTSIISQAQEIDVVPNCPECSSPNVKLIKGIEVGHAFLLGKKYTKTLQCKFTDDSGQKQIMEMGCYGIGVTRLLGAVVEAMSFENQIRWPINIAPFTVAVIPPKSGSKEEPQASEHLSSMLETLERIFPNNVILDDRNQVTIGKRLIDLKRLGIPYIVVLGKNLLDDIPTIEFVDITKDIVSKVELDCFDSKIRACCA